MRRPRRILRQGQVIFVLAYDADRVARTSGEILGTPVPPSGLCYRLDRFPSQAPNFLQLLRQNSGGKLYQIVNNR